MTSDSAAIGACCASVYGHPMATLVMGESLHPGGLALTEKVARLAGVEAGSLVLDAGCGRGVSAIQLAKTLGCHVTGITLEENGVAAGTERVRREGLQDLVTLRREDLMTAALEPGSFDTVLMECVLSILPEKETSLARFREALRPGGSLAITDVTVNGPLPEDLQGVLAVAGCVGDARSLGGYRELLESQGFLVETTQNLRETAEALLRSIKGKALMAEIAIKLGKLAVDLSLLEEGKALLKRVQTLVEEGTISYALLIARKPQETV